MPYKQRTLKNEKILILQMENMEWWKVSFYDYANFKSIMLKRLKKTPQLFQETYEYLEMQFTMPFNIFFLINSEGIT